MNTEQCHEITVDSIYLILARVSSHAATAAAAAAAAVARQLSLYNVQSARMLDMICRHYLILVVALLVFLPAETIPLQDLDAGVLPPAVLVGLRAGGEQMVRQCQELESRTYHRPRFQFLHVRDNLPARTLDLGGGLEDFPAGVTTGFCLLALFSNLANLLFISLRARMTEIILKSKV